MHIYIRTGTKVGKQHSKLCQEKQWIFKVSSVFINLALTLIDYIESLQNWIIALQWVLVLFLSLILLRLDWEMRQKQLASTFLEHAHIINLTFRLYKCTHVQTLKWPWQQSYKERNLALNAQQTNEGLNIWTLSQPWYTCTCTCVL